MIWSDNSNKCCGCLVCSIVCPHKCIDGVEDDYGFVMPKVDTAHCINCGLCEKVCPIQKEFPAQDITGKAAYAAYSKDEALHNRASSGGMFETAARAILAQGGSVFACKFDEKLQLRMQEATTVEQIQQLTKSKYIQSSCHNMFPIIKERVKDGKKVLVCATPCQIAALKNYLGSLAQLPQVYLMDFFCHGVPSQKLFDKCREYSQNKKKSKWLSYVFRFKPPHSTTLHYASYTEQTLKGKKKQNVCFYFEDPFYLGFAKYITLRDSCYHCPFGKGNHVADIIVGDLHESEKYWSQTNRYDGISKIVINTAKGQELWQQMQDSLHVKYLSIETLLKNGDIFAGPSSMPAARKAFMTDLKNLPFETFINKWLNPGKEWKKAIYYRLPNGIRKMIKKICLKNRSLPNRIEK